MRPPLLFQMQVLSRLVQLFTSCLSFWLEQKCASSTSTLALFPSSISPAASLYHVTVLFLSFQGTSMFFMIAVLVYTPINSAFFATSLPTSDTFHVADADFTPPPRYPRILCLMKTGGSLHLVFTQRFPEFHKQLHLGGVRGRY